MFLFSLMAKATSTTISPGSAESDNNIRAAFDGTADTIYLNPGTYIQANQIHFKRSAVLIAADMTRKPVIKLKYYIDLKNANTKIYVDGLIFDGTASEQQAICVDDANTGKELHLNNCEFRNFAKATITTASSKNPLDSCVINNCYFHDGKKSALYFPKSSVDGVQTCYGLIVKNSTFANYDVNESAEYYASLINLETYDYSNVVATDVKVLVDHCTFYNYLTFNTDHCAVRVRRAENVTVSNCIFAHPEAYERRSTYLYESTNTVSNCISYNLTKNADNFTHAWGPSVTSCRIADPLFKDAASGDYTLRMGSPARGAGVAGSNLGDPRWSAVADPIEADFASALTLEAADAVRNEYFTLNANNHLKANNPNPATENYGIATWQIHATKEVAVQVTLNINSASLYGHTYKVEIFDSSEDKKGEVGESGWKDTAEPVTLSGVINLPAAGDYKVKLSNTCNGSGEAIIEGITLSYGGGNVVEVPANSLGIEDALLSSGCKREDGVIKFPSTAADVPNAWVKWNMSVTAEAFYNVAVTIKNKYDHNITVTFYEEDGSTVVGSVTEGSRKSTKDEAGHTINMLGIYLKAGNYVAKLTNSIEGSDAKIVSVAFAAADGGAVQNLPCTMGVNDAWFTCGATRADGQITYGSWNEDNSWIKWNAATSDDIFCNVKVSLSTTNAHRLYVAIYEDEDEDPVATLSEAYSETIGDPLVRFLGRVYLPGGKNYVIKVTNPVGGSAAIINSVIFEEVVTPTVTLPGTLLPQDAMLSERATIDGDSLLFTARGDEAHNSSEWAKWKVSAAKGIYHLTLNAFNAAPEGQGQKFKITVLSNDETSEIATVTSEWMNVGARTVELPSVRLNDGNYIIKVEEPLYGATGRVLNIEVEHEQITIDELETNAATVIGANDGYAVNAHLSRAFVQGMYNTICLPFDVPAAELARVFPGAIVKELTSSSIEEGGFVLNLNFDAVDEMEAGVPYLIKPAASISNPKFLGVTIDNTLNNTETTNADFIGNFVVDEIAVSEDNLFLGADNTLYFPTVATEIKGLRAYFEVKNPSGAPIRHARIIEQGNVATEIEIAQPDMLDKAVATGVIKRIENGQLLIIREGVQYNALGVRVK